MALKYQAARFEVPGIFPDVLLLLNSFASAVVRLRVQSSISSLWAAVARQQWRWHKVPLSLW